VLVWTATRDRRPAGNEADGTVPPIRSLAVLPLTNVGNDSTQDFFADGLTDELTSALGHIPGLRVASRTSASTFKGTPSIDIREAGRRLGVNAVLEGSVRHAGPRLRIAVQLTSVADGLGLWSQTYEREARDIFVVQAEITAAIAEALQLTLGVAHGATDARSIDPQTYELYLRGRHLANLGTRQGLERSLELLRDVLQREPSFAPAQAAIGTAWMNLADAFVPPHEAYPRVIDAARHAVQLDSNIAEGHSLLAVGAMYQHEWRTVERELGRVRALTTSDPLALLTESFYRLMTGDSSGTIAATRRLLQVDPLTAWTNHTTSRQFILAGAREEGLAQARRAEEVAPDFLYGDSFTGYAYLAHGLVDEALERFEAASRTLGRPTPGLAKAYAVVGRRSDARRVLNELEALAKREYVFSPQLIAEAWATLGDYDRAFVWLDRSIRSGDAGAPLIPAVPEFAPMHSDPRWAELMRQLGIGVSPLGTRAIP
jgi:serine/threonine-protein kinase